MELQRRETLVLLVLSGVIALGAISGVIIDRLSGGDEGVGAASVHTPQSKRVIPWIAARPAEPSDSPSHVAGDWSTLVAGVSAPATVIAGGTLRYLVTLRNNGPQPVKLTTCPSYEQSLQSFDGGPPVTSRYLINCALIVVLKSEEEVLLQMVLAVPPSLPAGKANLLWKMDGGADTFASLRVVAS